MIWIGGTTEIVSREGVIFPFSGEILSKKVLGTDRFRLIKAVPDLDAVVEESQNNNDFAVPQRSAVTGQPLKGKLVSYFDLLELHGESKRKNGGARIQKIFR